MLKFIARRAYKQGREDQRAADVVFLYAQASLYRGRPSDAKRRHAIHYAADQIRDDHEPNRPQHAVETEMEREPRRLGWTFSPEGRVGA